MIIDIYTHLAPKSFLERMSVMSPRLGNITARLLGVKPLFDLDVRFKMMDAVPDYRQVISLSEPGNRGFFHGRDRPRTGADRQ